MARRSAEGGVEGGASRVAVDVGDSTGALPAAAAAWNAEVPRGRLPATAAPCSWSLPAATAARAAEAPTAAPCSLRKFRRCSLRAVKNASRVCGGHEWLPERALATHSSNSWRVASEIFSSALAREIQREDTPVANWFWRMYATCSSGPGLFTLCVGGA
jgi:hypothetical protein